MVEPKTEFMFWPLPFKYCVRFKFSKGIKAAHYHCHLAPYHVFMYMMTVQPSSYCYSLHHFYLQNVEFTFGTKLPSLMLHIFWFSHLVLFVDEEIPKGLLTSQTECPTFLFKHWCIMTTQEKHFKLFIYFRRYLRTNSSLSNEFFECVLVLHPRVITIYQICLCLIKHHWITWQTGEEKIAFSRWNKFM